MRLTGTAFSKVLNMDTEITVVTPNKLSKDYNVAYLLHGVCGNSKTWLDYSLLPVYASSSNTVFIMPEVARSFYTDMKYGFNYYTYVTEELPEICKSFFNISADRERTSIMGCSMGGYGALKCAFSKPEQYGKCAAFSSGNLFIKDGLEILQKDSEDKEIVKNFGEQLILDFKSIYGENFEWKPENDLTELAKKLNKENQPEIYLTCGTKDFFINDHNRFKRLLDDLGLNYTAEEWEAEHSFVYFNEALRKAIEKFNL